MHAIDRDWGQGLVDRLRIHHQRKVEINHGGGLSPSLIVERQGRRKTIIEAFFLSMLNDSWTSERNKQFRSEWLYRNKQQFSKIQDLSIQYGTLGILAEISW